MMVKKVFVRLAFDRDENRDEGKAFKVKSQEKYFYDKNHMDKERERQTDGQTNRRINRQRERQIKHRAGWTPMSRDSDR